MTESFTKLELFLRGKLFQALDICPQFWKVALRVSGLSLTEWASFDQVENLRVAARRATPASEELAHQLTAFLCHLFAFQTVDGGHLFGNGAGHARVQALHTFEV